MLIYNKQDLDGEPLRVQVKDKDFYSGTYVLEMTFKRPKSIFNITFWYKVYVKKKWVDENVINWKCKEIEEWVDEEINSYNKKIMEIRETQKFSSMIKNGDCD